MLNAFVIFDSDELCVRLLVTCTCSRDADGGGSLLDDSE